MSSEVAVKPLPRRGRIWVLLILVLALVGLGYAIVNISTKKPDKNLVHVEGIDEAQEIFGGVPQAGERIGSEDSPVSIQVFNDLQCSDCREDFLGTVPPLVEKYGHNAEVKLLNRPYSISENPVEIGFYGAEAAAEQGYGWQYTYLFYRNQDEAEKFNVDRDFLDSIAGGVEELEPDEWEEAMEKGGPKYEAITTRLEGFEKLGTDLGIRVGVAMIVNGPRGTRTLQEGPSLAEVEGAIEEVK